MAIQGGKVWLWHKLLIKTKKLFFFFEKIMQFILGFVIISRGCNFATMASRKQSDKMRRALLLSILSVHAKLNERM